MLVPLQVKAVFIWLFSPAAYAAHQLCVSYGVRLNWVKENTHTTRLKNSGGAAFESGHHAFGADCALLACIP